MCYRKCCHKNINQVCFVEYFDLTNERNNMSQTENESGICIGRGGNNDGCGFRGRESGDVCPDCGGMILSPQDLKEADALAAKFNEWEIKEEAEKILSKVIDTSKDM